MKEIEKIDKIHNFHLQLQSFNDFVKSNLNNN